MNSIRVINPYKWNGIWVFDDPAVDLDKEAFVAGADTLIDFATSYFRINKPENGFVMLFSDTDFPTRKLVLTWQRPELDGNIYRCTYPLLSKLNTIEGWLCPALLKYFGDPPEKIYVELRSK